MHLEEIAENIADNMEYQYACFHAAIDIFACEVTNDGKQLIYIITPKPGTKVNQIFERAIDVQTVLGIGFFRVIRDKSYIRIIIAAQPIIENSLQKILESPMFQQSSMWIPIALGYEPDGAMWLADLAKFPHVYYGGATLSGKTEGLKSLLVSVVAKQPVNRANIIIIDVATNDLNLFAPLPHLSCSIVKDIETAIRVISALAEEMERRSKFSIEELLMLPAIICVIDEYLRLLRSIQDNEKKAELTTSLAKLMHSSRHVKIHIVLATQEFSKKSMEIDPNSLNARIAFRCSSFQNSITILGEKGAEKLPGNGAMLFKSLHCPKPIYLQGAFMSTKDIEQLVANIASQHHDLSNKFSIPDLLPEPFGTPALDSPQPPAPEVALATVEYKSPSLDLHQKELADIIFWTLGCQDISCRKMETQFHIGRDRANRLLDKLFKLGIIEAKYANQPRRVIPLCYDDLSEEVAALLKSCDYTERQIRDTFATRIS